MITFVIRFFQGANGDILSPSHIQPLQITSVNVDSKSQNLIIQTTAKKSPKVRVHLIFRRFLPASTLGSSSLASVLSPYPPFFTPSRKFSQFLSTRNTNPEYQYILNRRGLGNHCIFSCNFHCFTLTFRRFWKLASNSHFIIAAFH